MSSFISLSEKACQGEKYDSCRCLSIIHNMLWTGTNRRGTHTGPSRRDQNTEMQSESVLARPVLAQLAGLARDHVVPRLDRQRVLRETATMERLSLLNRGVRLPYRGSGLKPERKKLSMS